MSVSVYCDDMCCCMVDEQRCTSAAGAQTESGKRRRGKSSNLLQFTTPKLQIPPYLLHYYVKVQKKEFARTGDRSPIL